jgi:ectoine hydroxylase-related dioxygenase (phytanoyl-CoA dioxygenase family)
MHFLEIAKNRNLNNLLSRILIGKYFLNQQNLVINPPKSDNYNQIKFHRDLPYQHYVSSRPLAINALLAVDDFTFENGTTVIIPASHKMENYPSDLLIDEIQSSFEVKAGTFLLLDCMTYHAAGINRSGQNRIGINHVFSSVMFRPQIDWNLGLSDDQKSGLSNDERQLLGIDFPIAPNVEAFLNGRK